jgi:DNA primase
VAKLLRLADELVFCFDGDAAGRKAAWRALEVSLPLAPDHKPIRFVFLPDGDDPDSYVRRHGHEAFEQLVRQGQTLSEFLLAELRAQSDLASAEGRARFISLAKPHIQKLSAPALRIQVINAVAELGRISDYEVRQLMEVADAPRFRRPAPARPRTLGNRSPEWSLLYSLLIDLPMAVHLEPRLLRADQPESEALLAIREVLASSEEDLSVGLLLERLQGNPSLQLVLQASRYGDELGFTQEDARNEIQGALTKLDVLRRRVELNAILGRGLQSKEEQLDYQQKMVDCRRLEGALPPEARDQA